MNDGGLRTEVVTRSVDGLGLLTALQSHFAPIGNRGQAERSSVEKHKVPSFIIIRCPMFLILVCADLLRAEETL
jgi:hypothetical protein